MRTLWRKLTHPFLVHVLTLLVTAALSGVFLQVFPSAPIHLVAQTHLPTERTSISMDQTDSALLFSYSDLFHQGYARLTPWLQRLVDRKLLLLSEHPTHPALCAHRVKCRPGKGIWECYVNRTLRLFYQRGTRDHLILLGVGGHHLIDRTLGRRFDEVDRPPTGKTRLPDGLLSRHHPRAHHRSQRKA